MTTLILSALAVLFSGPVPALLARTGRLRTVPRAAMTLWQAVALAAVLSALGAGLSLVTSGVDSTRGPLRYVIAAVALLLTATVVGRLLMSGHLVGTQLRTTRRRHRELVDLVSSRDVGMNVLEGEHPMAYCLPGIGRSRVVVTAGTLGRLSEQEMTAVLAHERAHLNARHDLVLEAFTVVHAAFPRGVSSAAALAEVRLLVEILADCAARRRTGRVPLARALVALADGPVPDAGLGASSQGLVVRIELLGDERAHRMLSTLVFVLALAVVVLPTAFVAWPWLSSLT